MANKKTVRLYITHTSYQLLIIEQGYFPFRAATNPVFSKYTTSTLAVLSALAFKPSQAFGLTGYAQQGDKPTQDLTPR
ncbi:hypothetical protein AVL55_19850 [Alteromonas macleodii]|uniref:Uncharacterized protein n=1 Tax=Alteromonas macleodii TaxID=28108 RepID=A0A126Q4S5_ALTMA|nr:hypothetical protein AVL55_19850 [Alteromonas macleodii]